MLNNSFNSITEAALAQCAKLGIHLVRVEDPDHPLVKLLHGHDLPIEGQFLLAQALNEPTENSGESIAWNILFRPMQVRASRPSVRIVLSSARGIVLHWAVFQWKEECLEDNSYSPTRDEFVRALWYMEVWRNEPYWFVEGQKNIELASALMGDPMAVVRKAICLLESGLHTQLSAVFFSAPDAQAAVFPYAGKAVVVRTLCHQAPCTSLTRIGSVSVYNNPSEVENPISPGMGLRPLAVNGPFLTWEGLENCLRDLFLR